MIRGTESREAVRQPVRLPRWMIGTSRPRHWGVVAVGAVWLLVLGMFLSLAAARAAAPEYDLIIRGARVVDGTGNPAFFADVAVTNGRIATVGRVTESAARVVEARGLVLAPGFIDVHTHADEIAEQPLAENFVRMGVTTIVAGNCGGSALDIAKLFDDMETNGAAVNFATLAGHNTVRARAMGGDHDRAPTEAELARMKELVAQAMRDGAAGLSTGLIYRPGVWAKTEEIVELARVAAAHGGLYATHMRNEGTRILDSLAEVARIAREAGIRAEVSHLKLSGEKAWGRAGEVLAFLDRARGEGLDLTWDQYVYTASSTGLSQLVPDEFYDGGRAEFRKRLDDPAQKARLVDAMKRRIHERGREDYVYAVIASCRWDPSLGGLNIVEAARKKRGGDSLEDQIELILEIERNGGASGVFHGMSEDDLRAFLRHPFTAVACDSGLREFGKGVPHPRGYGNNARVLGRYVRELGVLRLEDAVRRMTSLPAATFRFHDRGVVREGAWADLVLFDPERVRDRAEFNDPHHYAEGIPLVFVNGVAVVEDSRHTGAKPGHALRRR